MRSIIEKAVDAVLFKDTKSATIYESPRYRVTATRRHKSLHTRSVEVIVTLGQPNYRQREFLKQCKKAKVKFPITRPQLTFWPKKKR